MIDFDGGMNFIESERDNKHKTTTYDCTCNLKNLLKIIKKFCTFLIVFGSKRFGVCVYRAHGHKEMPFTNLFFSIS